MLIMLIMCGCLYCLHHMRSTCILHCERWHVLIVSDPNIGLVRVPVCSCKLIMISTSFGLSLGVHSVQSYQCDA